MTNQKAALSHAHAYVYEALEDYGYDYAGADGLIKRTQQTKNIRELVAVLDKTKFPFLKAKEFYQAMLKVVPHLKHFKEHGGTECRGWYRVWAAITQESGYFCSFDLGRDAGMAIDFVTHGAVTAKQYQAHVTKRTLKMMAATMTDGRVDTAKILDYFSAEYRDQCLDMSLVRAVEAAE
jgi:hypothetical protein